MTSTRRRPLPEGLRAVSAAELLVAALVIVGEIDIYLFDQIARGRFDARRRVLDAGCGGGRDSDVVPAERLRGAVRWTATRPPWPRSGRWRRSLAPSLPPAENIRVGALDALPWPDASMDAVVPAPCCTLRATTRTSSGWLRVWRVLRPGGLLFARLASSIGIEALLDADDRAGPPARRQRSLRRRRADAARRGPPKARREAARPDQDHQVQHLRCMTRGAWITSLRSSGP